MKMKPTHKDFYMEIRKSPGRFLSILFIVALGVAFFSGIRASEPGYETEREIHILMKAILWILKRSVHMA